MAYGKIARLPRKIRAQINQRLADGVLGHRLIDWLHTLPKVRRLLARHFGGRPINAQNLTNWRQGGHQRWLQQQAALAKSKLWQEWAAAYHAVTTRRRQQSEPNLSDFFRLMAGGLWESLGLNPSYSDFAAGQKSDLFRVNPSHSRLFRVK